jgi:hypothetical protein
VEDTAFNLEDLTDLRPKYNNSHYVRKIVAIASSVPVPTSHLRMVVFNVVVVPVYGAFIGILVWRRKGKPQSKRIFKL